jgi:multiple sugar transport system substrate-binding protein
MKKHGFMAAALSVSMAATLLLGGCSSGSASSSASSGSTADTSGTASTTTDTAAAASTASDEPVTLRVALWDYSNLDYYKTIFDAYTTANPNVKLDIVEFSADEYENTVTTQLAGKQNFDVVFIKSIPTLANMIQQGMVQPLDSYMEADTSFDKTKYSGLIEQLGMDGKYYGVPFRKDNTLIYYNKDLFDAAGVAYPTDDMSFQEYCDLAKKMTSGTGNDKVYGAHFHTWASNIYQYARRTEAYNAVDPTSYDSLIPLYEGALDLQANGDIQDYGSLKSSNIHYSGVFYNQQAAMLEIGTWFTNMMIENVGEGKDTNFNWGVCSLPTPDGSACNNAVGGVTPVTIGSYSEHPEAAWKFITFICGEEGGKTLASCGIVPGYNSDAINQIFDGLHTTYPNAPEGLSKYIDLDKYVIESVMDPNAKAIDTAITEEHSAIMTNSISPADGIAELQQKVKDIQAGNG